MIETTGTTRNAKETPAPKTNKPSSADTVLRQVSDIVLDAAEAIHHLAMQHMAAYPVVSRHVQELAETLAGSTVDWIREWPT